MNTIVDQRPGVAADQGEWLSPTAALARFSAPAGSLAGATSSREETLRHGFRIGGIGLLVPAKTGTEVVVATQLARIPRGARALRGILNLRGNLIPVFDLNVAIGNAIAKSSSPADRAQKSVVLVFGKGENAAGLLIDDFPMAVPGLRPAGQLGPLPDPLAAHVTGALATAEQIWLEFAHEGLFQVLAGPSA